MDNLHLYIYHTLQEALRLKRWIAIYRREVALKLIKFHLQRAQNRMKQKADKKRLDKNFELHDLVYVKLQPYR